MKYLIALSFVFLLPKTAEAFKSSCGTFHVVKGKVQYLERKGAKRMKRARQRARICSGGTVVTDANSRALIKMPTQDEIHISPNSKLVIEDLKTDKEDKNKKRVLINVIYGKLRANLKKDSYDNSKKNQFRVKTKSAVAGVRGTQFLTSQPQGGAPSEIVTFRGQVEVGQPTGNGFEFKNPVMVGAGQKTRIALNKPPAPPIQVPKAEFQQLNQETQADSADQGTARNDDGQRRRPEKKDPDKREPADDGKSQDDAGKKDPDKKDGNARNEGDKKGPNAREGDDRGRRDAQGPDRRRRPRVGNNGGGGGTGAIVDRNNDGIPDGDEGGDAGEGAPGDDGAVGDNRSGEPTDGERKDPGLANGGSKGPAPVAGGPRGPQPINAPPIDGNPPPRGPAAIPGGDPAGGCMFCGDFKEPELEVGDMDNIPIGDDFTRIDDVAGVITDDPTRVIDDTQNDIGTITGFTNLQIDVCFENTAGECGN